MLVKPGSGKPGIARNGEHIVVRVSERAHEGKANEACRRALAAALHTAPSRVELVRGARSKHKLFRVTGLSGAAIHAALARRES